MAKIVTKTTDNLGNIKCLILDPVERFVVPFPNHPVFNDWTRILGFTTVGLTTDRDDNDGMGSDGPYGDDNVYVDIDYGNILRNSTLFGFMNKPSEFPGENGCDFIGLRPDFTNNSQNGFRSDNNNECKFFYNGRAHMGLINGDGSFTDGTNFNYNFALPDGNNISDRSGNYSFMIYFELEVKNKGEANQSFYCRIRSSFNTSRGDINQVFAKLDDNSIKDSLETSSNIVFSSSKDMFNSFIMYMPYQKYRFKIFNFGIRRLS